MPIYEYRCEGCGEKFELLVGFSTQEKILCPKCGGADVKRCFSTVGIRGSGGFSSSGGSCGSCSAMSCATCR